MEARTADGSTALHLAARHGELDVANEILKGSEHLADAMDWKGEELLQATKWVTSYKWSFTWVALIKRPKTQWVCLGLFHP